MDPDLNPPFNIPEKCVAGIWVVMTLAAIILLAIAAF